MYAVERLGNYITRGVYHVSGPFHPFGGAVDIIVVEQPDGSFKSSPWYVRFGKFQGVLKSREKVVNISVNGVEANFSMYLDQRGHAYFLREVEGEEGDYMLLQSSSNGETDLLSPREVRNLKSKSCNYDGNDVCLIDQIDTNIGKDDGRTNSCRERMLGLAYRQRDVNKDSPKGCAEENVMRRFSSLDRAEMAASLLEVKWTTDLATKRSKKRNATRSAASYTIVFEKNEQRQPDPAMQNSTETSKGAGSDSDVEQDSPSVLRLSSIDGVVLTTDLDEDVLKEEHVTISSMSMNVDGPGSPEVNCNGIANDAVTDFFVPGSCISNQESRCDRVHSTSNDSLERSTVGMYGEKEQIHDTLNVASGPGGQIFDAEAFPATTEGKQGNQHDENFKSETKCVETCGKGFTRVNSDVLNLDIDIPVISPECSSPVLGFARILDTVGGEMSKNAFDDSSSIILNEQVENGGGEKDINTNEPSLDNSESFHDDCRLKKASSVPVSHITDDNQFLFSDRDELKVNDSMKEVEKCENSNNEPCSFPGDQENQSPNRVNSTTSTPIEVPKAQSVPDLMSLSISNNLDADDPKYPLSRSLDSPSNSGKWKLDVNDVSSSVHVDSANGNQLEQELLSNGDALQNEAASPSVGNPSEPEASGRNWRLWPFSLKKSGSRNSTQPSLSGARSDAGTVSGESVSGKSVEKDKDHDAPNTRVFKKVARANAPTSEQLAELNLKEGSNSVTFTFSTSMLGKQQVEARIYRWKWNTRIVISDVDGTITKSDVLGQFMPLVGVDWSQMGVAHLFSDIKKNGYQLLFLSARAISQAYHTRRFLFNLKQDGKCLPDGPVVISPDGLFPSLFREVIRRCPHEFKIACLEDIKVLFPPDCSPFYAGFGNRDTDEISYLKVGIPRGKIFTINPKGEVSVNRRIDRKSYTSLHALVHDMFPPTLSSEQEDFNSWNFWKLPPPLVDT